LSMFQRLNAKHPGRYEMKPSEKVNGGS